MLLVTLMLFRLLSVVRVLNPFSLSTTLDVSFFERSLTLPLMFYLFRRVPVLEFSCLPPNLLASVIDFIDFVDLFESSEHLLLVRVGSCRSLDFSWS
jgi:hypothetical protein